MNKKKFKRLCLKLVSLFVLYSSVASADLDYLLWRTESNASGDINYSGSAIDFISGVVNSLNTGTMSVVYKECNIKTASQKIIYAMPSRWVFFPKKIIINNQIVAISISEPPSGYNIGSYDGSYYVIKQIGDLEYNNQPRLCSAYAVGKTYPINYTYPKFNIKLDVSGLSVGNYSGTIPIKMAYAEYFDDSSNITLFSDNMAFQYATEAEVPYAININNKCTVTPESLSLEHGDLHMADAEGNTVSKAIVVNCEEPASFSVNLQSRNIPSPVTSYSDGVGVDLGNGWVSEVTVGNSGLSDVSLTGKTISVPVGGLSCPISSTLRKNGTVTSGNISGSLVIVLEIK